MVVLKAMRPGVSARCVRCPPDDDDCRLPIADCRLHILTMMACTIADDDVDCRLRMLPIANCDCCRLQIADDDVDCRLRMLPIADCDVADCTLRMMIEVLKVLSVFAVSRCRPFQPGREIIEILRDVHRGVRRPQVAASLSSEEVKTLSEVKTSRRRVRRSRRRARRSRRQDEEAL
eukprot:48246-Prorocentrum_minimum.AAC.1